ncbi:uncharacterized protein B0I36DRAFT_329054 [Microdochium trichocladiopsis]|uniref:Uncharacterized protein n=1 Tax=Microdochium trichocladiopsis TaxID=1682393 RepID=A0A9P9BJN1_9PEZI|nr:uncharacterized protein B0I36DRAFT_329054 [Microdochium trichocladiopsis]KAH7025749.1 hypothetical protein B0I36DRAFT_329054 [Microdochium trichocladiopsis]
MDSMLEAPASDPGHRSAKAVVATWVSGGMMLQDIHPCPQRSNPQVQIYLGPEGFIPSLVPDGGRSHSVSQMHRRSPMAGVRWASDTGMCFSSTRPASPSKLAMSREVQSLCTTYPRQPSLHRTSPKQTIV